MKNWKLWLVISILFIGTAVTLGILYYKEKKKQSDLAQRLAQLKPSPKANLSAPNAEPIVSNVVTEVQGTARSVVQETPTFFGSRS